MSTPLHDTPRARTVAVPAPRQAADPPLDPDVRMRPSNRQMAETEAVGLFGRHGWLVPAVGIACVVAVFVAMVLLTWIAGGGTPFDR